MRCCLEQKDTTSPKKIFFKKSEKIQKVWYNKYMGFYAGAKSDCGYLNPPDGISRCRNYENRVKLLNRLSPAPKI